MNNFVYNENIGLCSMRQFTNNDFSFCLATKYIIDNRTFYSNRGKVNLFPLYIYTESKAQSNLYQSAERTPNLSMQLVGEIAKKLGFQFTSEKEQTSGTFAPIDLLDYIYAVLHSPTYREKYKEFLKIDFPRVPYPKDADTFWQLVKLGGELRQIHLLESPVVSRFITKYPVEGNNLVTKPRFEPTPSETHQLVSSSAHQLGTVWINDEQYFDRVPIVAWNFYIGGYQPAQKWLKDRKGRVLNFEDIQHYQKIIVALTETERIMGEIDGISIE
jgi:predicted helicase